ncbi:MAG: FdtA/QdtA family cupin domain-containing protein [Paramuribaculum sp.]|nr:FdtA/QdtA family cupin domain-containing protein [Paramuribaculum sp.]
MFKLFHLPEFRDSRGNLTFVEEVTHLPFEIRDVYLLSGGDIPDSISLDASALIMAPKGETIIAGKKLTGIDTALLVSSQVSLPLTVTAETVLIILSAGPINGLTSLSLPFKPRRAYFMAEIPTGKSRGNHAHFATSQMIYALQGKFDIDLDNGTTQTTATIIEGGKPVEVQLGVWRTLHRFSPDALCMVLASELFNPDDYISEYPEFLERRKSLR